MKVIKRESVWAYVEVSYTLRVAVISDSDVVRHSNDTAALTLSTVCHSALLI
jgi:hypothetical protein